MKRILLTTFVLFIAMGAMAYTTSVQNPGQFDTRAGAAGEIVIIEDWGGELSGATMIMEMDNSALWYTITEENAVAPAYANSGVFPDVLGIIGTNRIVIHFPEFHPPAPVVFKLSNVWLNSQYLDREADITADFMAVIYGTPVQRNDVVLGHWTPPADGSLGDIPLDTVELKYWTCSGKWWTGAVLINDTTEPVDIPLAFTRDDGTVFILTLTIESQSFDIFPLYEDPRLDGFKGYVKVTIPPGCDCVMLTGDGTQMIGM